MHVFNSDLSQDKIGCYCLKRLRSQIANKFLIKIFSNFAFSQGAVEAKGKTFFAQNCESRKGGRWVSLSRNVDRWKIPANDDSQTGICRVGHQHQQICEQASRQLFQNIKKIFKNIQKYFNRHFDSFLKIFHLCAANCAVSTLKRHLHLHLHYQCDHLCDHDDAADDDEDDADGEDDEDEDDIG